jgi:hypothetical protein
MICEKSLSGTVPVDLQSQIVTQATAVPSTFGPSGARHAARMGAGNAQVTFNLATTRVINFNTSGPKTVFYRIKRDVMGGARCEVHDAAFTVYVE